MRKALHILGFFATLNLSFFNLTSTFAGSLILEVPDNPEPITQNLTYQCDTKANKERIEISYFNAGDISLADFKWKGDRVIAAHVTTPTGKKYAGAQYILWKTSTEAILYDLVHDPEEKNPLLCKEESTLLF
ncbi:MULTISPECIES: MliC family protein [unclassified Bartonella]|uniref:MliC family protein n=1 Tax=unclassified Bartonella TaxID=2645622 RepID=UPI00300E1065